MVSIDTFSRMLGEGFPFYTLGVWGWRCVRWTPFWCSQPSPTVRNRSRTTVVAESCRAYGKSCKKCHFCYVFCKNRIGRAARSGDQVQIPWQAWHFVRCDDIWRKPRTKHRFWGGKFSASCENSSENVDFWLTTCQNCRNSRTNCVFWCFHVCPCVSLAAPCLSGSCKTFRLRRCPNVKIGGSLAWNARIEASTCVVSTFWLSPGSAVSIFTLHTTHSTLYTLQTTLYVSILFVILYVLCIRVRSLVSLVWLDKRR